ncbi:hypothetical protein M0D21_16275 [Aquimarina sp. D1M17]|uniref:hypothetical protein n=1 Tax=Aquimarina acroporae TaxID=2937283 RepID=UPI0020C11E73|nr:hypothetical protein [Aquimarina acroporae]MCK8523136.1 hypothetical protein [Aquimarina acroporae]
MKSIFHILMLLIFSNTIGQETPGYIEIRKIIERSASSLNTALIVPDSDFYIGIRNNGIVENIDQDPCIDIQSDDEKNKQILAVLKKHKLLDSLYMGADNQFINLRTSKSIKPENTKFYIELTHTGENAPDQIFIPILEYEKAYQLIEDLNIIFDNEACYKKLIRKMR